MTDSKPCIRCQRAIDRYAKLCVYCNWDQSNPNPEPPQPIAGAVAYVPPADHRARNRILGAAGLLVAIIGAFVVGMFIHGADAKEVKRIKDAAEVPVVAETTTRPRSNVTLVPVDGADPSLTVPIEQSITSAPPTAPGQDASDATAMPSEQYAAVAAQAKAQKARQQAEVDPRSLRGASYEAAPRPAAQSEPASEESSNEQPQTAENATSTPNTEPNAPEPERAAAPARTEAYPEYKPLPQIRVDENTTARLTLTVGADGRVKEVDIVDPIPGETSKLIAAVQRWRFRPATENGTPVSARVAVTITLHDNE